MSGHSKWSTIKRDKGSNDAKRGQLFTKLARAVTSAAKKSGPNPLDNPFLRKAIDDARSQNMPKDNIDRAIAKASGVGAGEQLDELILEGYGPSGVALLITVLTDNRNRTLSEVRGVFNRHGSSLGQPGSASYVFAGEGNIPSFSIEIGDLESARKIISLVEDLEALDDVQKVFANFDIPDEYLEIITKDSV